MKILFICGSLEPGKDGVGDYTRRLACTLKKQGVAVAAVALNDRHIIDAHDTQQESEGVTLPVLRIPAIWTKAKQTALAKQWVTQHNPDWLSLQFVPYSFHHKGLPFGLAKQLKAIATPQVKWHIMFHELWIGMSKNSGIKQILIGKVREYDFSQVKNIIEDLILSFDTQNNEAIVQRMKELVPEFKSNNSIFQKLD